MAHHVPSFAVIAFVPRDSLALGRFAHNFGEERQVRISEIDVFDRTTKMEFERSVTNPNFFHIRACFLNKYWSFVNQSTTEVIIGSDQKCEDASQSTLFEPLFDERTGTHFIRSVSRGRLLVLGEDDGLVSISDLTDPPITNISQATRSIRFRLIEWDTLIRLPKYVSFRGHNNKFLKAWSQGSNIYVSASSDEGDDRETSFEVIERGDGHVRIQSLLGSGVWYNLAAAGGGNWIVHVKNATSILTLFWPIKVGGNVIALRSAQNNSFCRSLTQGNLVDCLSPSGTTINSPARLIVSELVTGRRMYDVRYHMDNARIYGQRAVVAGTGHATNRGQQESTLTVEISVTEHTSYTFSNSNSLSTGVSTSITAGFGYIVTLEVGIEISSEQTVSVEVGKEVSRTTTSTTSYAVPVPPMSTVIVNYVATEGKCDIPFSYTQRDQDSIDGSFRYSTHEDGVYTGVNYFNFHYDQPRFRSLQEEENVE
ncbi:uncharacterized protein LOC126653841 [Mercurialis annua]|uniref:uncharacterized protein LOC126653841 n=1 Tax=Mercurialis annua TaxID=3986 RepID=UPI00215DE2AD|nr:uncharacterized protein LOC126653841 [Mercurialis annua]